MANPARKRDYRAQIRAIKDWFGEREGLTFKSGRPKRITNERLAELLGCAPQTVKKWFQRDFQVPERESIIALNKIAPPHLRIPMGEEQPTPAQLPQSNGLAGPATSTALEAVMNWLNDPNRPPLSRADFAKVQAVIETLETLQGKS